MFNTFSDEYLNSLEKKLAQSILILSSNQNNKFLLLPDKNSSSFESCKKKMNDDDRMNTIFNKFINENKYKNFDIYSNIFNRIKIILGTNIPKSDYAIKEKIKIVTEELIETNDCQFDFLKSFIALCITILGVNNRLQSCKYSFINICVPFVVLIDKSRKNSYYHNFFYQPIDFSGMYTGDFLLSDLSNNINNFYSSYIKYDNDVLYDIILKVINKSDLSLLSLFFIKDRELYSVNAINFDIIKYGIFNSLKEAYLITSKLKGEILIDKESEISKIIHQNPDKCTLLFEDEQLLDNNFGTFSKKDAIKLALYMYDDIYNWAIMFTFFKEIDKLAEKILEGKISFEEVEKNFSILKRLYKTNSVRYITSSSNFYDLFIKEIEFFKNYNELNYKDICNIYDLLLINTKYFCVKEQDYSYLYTKLEENLSHFKKENTKLHLEDIIRNNEIKEFKHNFRKFLINKFGRSFKNDMMNKICNFYRYYDFDEIKSKFNKITIKSLKSVRFANPALIYLAMFNDLSNLSLKTRVFLNYYIYNFSTALKLKDSPLLNYIIKYGDTLSNVNITYILSNITIPGIEVLTNMKDIEKHVILNEVYIEKKKAEEEYGFNFDEISVCSLVDNEVELDGYRMRLLDTKDPKVFILGKLCDCCYHMGGAAEDSMIYSIVMPNSGNIVIEDIISNEVIATAWVWYDEKNDIYVYDNFEFSKDSLMSSCIDIIEKYSMELPYKNVHVGLDYNQDMDRYFNRLYDYKEAEFINPEVDFLDDDIYSDYDQDKTVIKINGNSNRKILE